MTKEDIIRMAIEAGWDAHHAEFDTRIQTFAALVASAEREACAEICDGFYLSWINIQGRYEFMGEGASECAGAIRTRGNHD